MFLQRHGECETNVSKIFICRKLDPVLTEHGKHQIEVKAHFYKSFDIKRIFTSPSKRASQSADIISRVLGIEYLVDEALLEVDVGELEGKSERNPQNLELFFGILNEWFFNGKNVFFPGGESKEKVESRIEKAISLLSPSTILIGHVAFFAVLLWKQRMRFTEIKELFLPRAGTAQYFDEKGYWEIIRPIYKN